VIQVIAKIRRRPEDRLIETPIFPHCDECSVVKFGALQRGRAKNAFASIRAWRAEFLDPEIRRIAPSRQFQRLSNTESVNRLDS
jgi:hypothetical protein